MKKVSLLVACIATMLVLSTMSFAAEEAAACDAAAPAVCECGAAQFAYPPANKVFGNRLAVRRAQDTEVVLGKSANVRARRPARNVPLFVVPPPAAPQEECEAAVKAPVIEFNFLSAVRGVPRYSHPLHGGAAQDFAAVVGQGGTVKAPIVNFNFLSAVRGPQHAQYSKLTRHKNVEFSTAPPCTCQQ